MGTSIRKNDVIKSNGSTKGEGVGYIIDNTHVV